jgi:hypothetical protein
MGIQFEGAHNDIVVHNPDRPQVATPSVAHGGWAAWRGKHRRDGREQLCRAPRSSVSSDVPRPPQLPPKRFEFEHVFKPQAVQARPAGGATLPPPRPPPCRPSIPHQRLIAQHKRGA